MITYYDADVARRVTEFWSRVSQGKPDDCWPWTGYTEDGYGRYFFGGRMVGAHELAVTFTTGERRADSLDTCHSCNNPICCNPRHLRFDTRRSNVEDMDAAGRRVNTTPRLTAEKVETIRIRRAHGAKQQDLADDYGVTNGLISQIVRGRRWASAPGPIETERKYNRGE